MNRDDNNCSTYVPRKLAGKPRTLPPFLDNWEPRGDLLCCPVVNQATADSINNNNTDDNK